MQIAGSADSLAERTGSAAYTSEAGAWQVADEEIGKASIDPVDEDPHDKEVSLILLHP